MAVIITRHSQINLWNRFGLKLRAFYSSQPQQETKNKLGKVVNVAIIGAPNSGKSTLINNIVGRATCAASKKVHTTTKLIRAMCFQNDTQIVFLDTPGVVTEKEKNRYNLPEGMLSACHKSLRCADIIGVVHDVSNRHLKDSLHPDVVGMLRTVVGTPSFLILNKVDRFKSKDMLLSVITHLTNGCVAGQRSAQRRRGAEQGARGFDRFSDVFLVSALKGDGVVDIKDYLINNAKPSNYFYQPGQWTDQSPEAVIEEAVRAKLLDFLPQEIPYNLKTVLEYYEERPEEDKVICHVFVECPSERLARLIAGAAGGRLQQIKNHVRSDLMHTFKKLVVIDIRLTTPPKAE